MRTNYNQLMGTHKNKERLAKLENSKDRRIIDLENDMRLFKEFVKSIKK